TSCKDFLGTFFGSEMAHFEPSKENLVPLSVKRPHPGMGRFEWIRRPLFLTLLMVAGLIGTCWGQGTQGGITGRVSDSSGASIPGAAVHLTNSATNASLDVTTTETGDFSFHGLTP